MKWKRVKYHRKRIASRHIERLLELSFDNLEKRPERSRRYVKLARDIIRKHKVQLSKEQKLRFCKECNTPLLPGKTCRVRTSSGMISITCLHCGSVRRFPFRQEQRLQRERSSYAEKKYPGGLVCAKVVHKDGSIRSVKITGDFFLYPEEKLALLEASLKNISLPEVSGIVSKFYVDEGIESPGVGPESFAEVIALAIKTSS